MTHARIVDGVAVEIIGWNPVGRYPEGWTWVECPSGTKAGATYDGEAFTNPVEPDPPEPEATEPTKHDVSIAAFWQLITVAEEIAVRDYAVPQEGDDETKALNRKMVATLLRRLDDQRVTRVDLKSTQVVEGIDALVGMGLLTAPRAAEVKAGTPPA